MAPKGLEPVADEGVCMIWGDPHAKVFDGKKALQSLGVTTMVDLFSHGDFWIVKSPMVSIQGRYGATQWTVDGMSATRALAISGEFLKGHKLIIEPTQGHVTWDGERILQELPSEFGVPGLVTALYEDGKKAIDAGKSHRPLRTVFVELPLGIKLTVNRWTMHIDVMITMPALPEGQDGHCGNFNGDLSDDTLEKIQARLDLHVAQRDSLFADPPSTYIGCFADKEGARNRDLVAYKGEFLSHAECAQACKDFKYFGRQWTQECWCGWSYGRHGQLSSDECACESENIGDDRNCVYGYGSLGVAKAKSLNDCPSDVYSKAAKLCGEATEKEVGEEADHMTETLKACIFDVCFGGEQFAQEDAIAEKLAQ